MASTDRKNSSPSSPGLKPPLSTSVPPAPSSPYVYVSVLPDPASSQRGGCLPGQPVPLEALPTTHQLPQKWLSRWLGSFFGLSPTLHPQLPLRRSHRGPCSLTTWAARGLSESGCHGPSVLPANPISNALLGKLLVQRPPGAALGTGMSRTSGSGPSASHTTVNSSPSLPASVFPSVRWNPTSLTALTMQISAQDGAVKVTCNVGP